MTLWFKSWPHSSSSKPRRAKISCTDESRAIYQSPPPTNYTVLILHSLLISANFKPDLHSFFSRMMHWWQWNWTGLSLDSEVASLPVKTMSHASWPFDNFSQLNPGLNCHVMPPPQTWTDAINLQSLCSWANLGSTFFRDHIAFLKTMVPLSFQV